MRREIVVGSRQSRLALWQAQWVVEQLKQRYPGRHFRIVGMKTKGDHILDVPLAKIGDKGLFTRELENALLAGECDLAVHSMKDLPTRLPPGLTIGAICRREYPGDVLISRRMLTLQELPPGARLGTSSLRRKAQLLRFRPDLQMVDVRGNLTTRLRKLAEQQLDGLVLAYAGVCRLGVERAITQKIPFSICLPAVGQGSVGVEIREGDEEIRQLLAGLDDPAARPAITAERAFLRKLEGGCQVPIGALGRVENGALQLEGIVLTLDGRRYVRESVSGPPEEAVALGEELAARMLAKGAGAILEQVRQEFGL
ncbi:MAG: hydroxymethylbilane synthase [Bacillota bacterium]